MACHALGRCRICARKHKIPVFGSEEVQHVLVERANLKLIILNTVCVSCISKIERIVGKMDLDLNFGVSKSDSESFGIGLSSESDPRQPTGQSHPHAYAQHPSRSGHRSSSVGPPGGNGETTVACQRVATPDERCHCGVCYLCASGLPLLAEVVNAKSATTSTPLPPAKQERTFTVLEPSARQEPYGCSSQCVKYETETRLRAPDAIVGQDHRAVHQQSGAVDRTGTMLDAGQIGDRHLHDPPSQLTHPPRLADCGSETYAQGGKKSARDMACDFCEKRFTHAGDLNKHRRRHTGERPYECAQCQRKFAHASNLARHQRMHSGERPFSCPQCGRSFTRRDKLANHVSGERCRTRATNQPRSPA